MIYMKAAREAYNDDIITDIIWIRREYNLADVMTRPAIITKLIDTLKEVKLHYKIEQSIAKEIRSEQKEKKSECENVAK